MALARSIAWLWFYLVPIRRKLAEDQVARALGPKLTPRQRRRIVRGAFENACMYAVEELRMPQLSAAVSKQTVGRDGIERMDALLREKRGVIAVTAHVGNFELMGSSQTVRGYPISAVLKDIGYAPAQAFWDAARIKTKLGRIPPRRARDQIVCELAQNRIVAFLIDQHMAPYRSVVCHFFGQLAATSTAPVRFALETGAPILPLYSERVLPHGHHVIHFGAPMALVSPSADAEYNLWYNTQRLTTLIEAWVRRHPEQWLWMHKRWKVLERPTGYDTRFATEDLARVKSSLNLAR